jgi:hypothetical protein
MNFFEFSRMKSDLFPKIFIILVFLILSAHVGWSTHLRAGQITATRLDCNSLTFRITITVYTNTIDTNVLFGGDDDILDFGDGSDPDGDGRPGMLVPEQPNREGAGLPPGVAYATFTIDWTYSGNSTYTISYSEPNRNRGVVNMDESGDTRFYLETQVSLDPYFGCNKFTPILQVAPIDVACTNVAWFHNPGAADLDGDSLSYEMLIPFRARNSTVVNYRAPNDPSFYDDFAHGDETGTKAATFGFDVEKKDGTLKWDAPGSPGEYNIAFLIKEWRQIDGEWVVIGFVRRDMQILVEECENNRPDLIVPERLCVVAGKSIEKTIFGIDPDNDNVKIEAFSEILVKNFPSHATVSVDPNNPDAENVYQPSVPPAEVFFKWDTKCEHIKDQDYQVVFKISDKPAQGPSLVTFKTWQIRVVGPPPVLKTATEVDESVTITWDPYACANAEVMQIWRRVNSIDYPLDTCITGMPPNLGYELIATQDIDDPPTFTDTNNGKGLAGGAVYCYRLVAVFPLPKGGESLVSNEVCEEILADEPVITNVTIDETDDDAGKITVKWVAPFENTGSYSTPFKYRLFRSEGFNQSTITELSLADNEQTSFTDAGLNTRDLVYNYQVLALDADNDIIDTSAVASSVRVEAQSLLNSIQLNWSAQVPWSIQSAGFPHSIYRIVATEDDLPVSLADFGQDPVAPFTQVDVTSEGLTFLDDIELEEGKLYCYIVETLGTYGNDDPAIASLEPFHNFSQVVCSQPGDETKPCKPDAPIGPQFDCDNPSADAESQRRVQCDVNIFSNEITWTKTDDPDCGANDIAYYLIYYSKTSNGTFVALQDENNEPVKVFGTSYKHTRNLTSFAGCYKIAAVDRSGNESEMSDPLCIENCPNYELPNVFSPNGDLCNGVFSAYGNLRNESGEEAENNCITSDDLTIDDLKCARYVIKVDFAVFNRWGKQVYDYESEQGNENKSIYIRWDGRSSDGSDLAAGVYFYVAHVTFDTALPENREKTFKGWIQLMR